MGQDVMHLPIYTRETIAADGSRRQRLVFCPVRRRAIDPALCRVCDHVRSISPVAVDCAPALPHPNAFEDRRPAAGTIPAGAVASATFRCLDGDLTGEAAAPFLTREAGGLPVVDARERFCGFVSLAIPGKGGLPARLSSTMRVRDLAVGHALTIGEGCSLREALEAMALRHARVLAVVDDDGTVRGVLTDIGALRTWAALRREP